MAEDYDIAGAIKRIEDELIASMIRNLDRHRAEEDDLGINWEQWQVKQFAALEEYRKRNLKQYADKFNDINKRIAGLITLQREAGNADQEIAILEALRKGARLYRTGIGISGEFFRMNDRKMDALIRATTNDMQKAEYAMLRMSNDRYRQVIFNAQMYAASGSGTYEKAVDMATKDFLRAGINCVEYKNGARHTLSDYADMAIRTASKRAYLTGEGEKRMEWGVSTVIMNKRGNPCPKCLPFVGKVLIDDVWSGGSRKDGKYPLMSSAIAAGLYHPRCKDGHTTYFPGISDTPNDKFTRKELQTIEEQNRAEAEQQYAQRQAEAYGRLAEYSLDEENRKAYKNRESMWKEAAKMLNESEEGAVIRYVSPDAYALNDKLRRNAFDELTALEKEWMKNLDKALDKLPNYNGNLNRSLTFSSDEDAKEFVNQFIVGEEYEAKQYLSATTKGVYNEDGQVQIYISNASKGKDLGDIGIESEVLYPFGSKFSVINIAEQEGKHYILLEEK